MTQAEDGMDCEACERQLIDLVCGELQPDAIAAVEAALARCPGCQTLHDQLRQGATYGGQLELREPPESIAARVMEVARQRAGQQDAAPIEPPPPPPPQGWRGVLDWLGRVAMGRQVTMAMIMLLLVAVGLWYVPRSDQPPHAAGGSVTHPDPEGATASVPELAEQVAAKDGAEEAAPSAEPGGEAQPEASRRERAQLADRGRVRPQKRFAPKPGAARGAGALAERRTRGRSAGAPAKGRGSAVAADEASQPSEAEVLHRRARAARHGGNCGLAVRRYRVLLADHPDYGGRPAAMVEIGLCYQALGDVPNATRWLRRAVKQPSVASRARSALQDLQRAQAPAATANQGQ